jgi:DNA topoisomerase I
MQKSMHGFVFLFLSYLSKSYLSKVIVLCMPEEIPIKLSHKEFLKTNRDYERSAKVVNLHYVKDNEPGIKRIKRGKGYRYVLDEKPLKEKKEIARIKKLAIPPAWEEVWICRLENGHIQATGLDLRKRKQYRYHQVWNWLRHETKFHRLYEFGKALPKLREKIESDISTGELSQERIIAIVLKLMEHTYIRVGNQEYEKMNGSYGLTTLKNKHVTISGDKLLFSFTGKKGIRHNISLKNKKLAKAVKQCKEIPGKELFQYYESDGTRKSIDSGMVNQYIKEASGTDFSAKDFRTWAGSLHALNAFKSMEEPLTETDKKKNIIQMLDTVREKLGNTRTVCRKYYVHPRLINLYEENKLGGYLDQVAGPEETAPVTGLSAAEEILMTVLKA